LFGGAVELFGGIGRSPHFRCYMSKPKCLTLPPIWLTVFGTILINIIFIFEMFFEKYIS